MDRKRFDELFSGYKELDSFIREQAKKYAQYRWHNNEYPTISIFDNKIYITCELDYDYDESPRYGRESFSIDELINIDVTIKNEIALKREKELAKKKADAERQKKAAEKKAEIAKAKEEKKKQKEIAKLEELKRKYEDAQVSK